MSPYIHYKAVTCIISFQRILVSRVFYFEFKSLQKFSSTLPDPRPLPQVVNPDAVDRAHPSLNVHMGQISAAPFALDTICVTDVLAPEAAYLVPFRSPIQEHPEPKLDYLETYRRHPWGATSPQLLQLAPRDVHATDPGAPKLGAGKLTSAGGGEKRPSHHVHQMYRRGSAPVATVPTFATVSMGGDEDYRPETSRGGSGWVAVPGASKKRARRSSLSQSLSAILIKVKTFFSAPNHAR